MRGYDFLLINDSDITVWPRYLERVMAHSPRIQARTAEPATGGTGDGALSRPRQRTVRRNWRRWGSRPIFSRGAAVVDVEGGLRYGLGSTLAVRREALDRIGGLDSLVDYLADDYESGARVSRRGLPRWP